MKEVIYNYDNLKENEIDEIVIRCKGLIVNNKNEIMLGYCHNTYQFPGGFLEDDETLIEGLKREILEETGIILDDKEIIKQICTISQLNKDYPKKGINRLTEFSYYYVLTNKKVNLNNINYDKWEQDNNFKLKYISIDEFEKVLNKTKNDNPMNEMIYKDMIKVFSIIKKEL